MAIAVVQRKLTHLTGSLITYSFNNPTVAGNTLFMTLSWLPAGGTSPVFPNGWQAGPSRTTGNVYVGQWFLSNAASQSSFAVQFSSSTPTSWRVHEVSGMGASPVLLSSTSNFGATAGAAITLATGSISTSGAAFFSAIIAADVCSASTDFGTFTGGFSAQGADRATLSLGASWGDLINSGAGSANYGLTDSNTSTNLYGLIGAYGVAAAGGPFPFHLDQSVMSSFNGLGI